MLSAPLGGHALHFVVFGVPVAGLAGALGWQEVRARRAKRASDVEAPTDLATMGLRVAAGGFMAAAAIHGSVIAEHLHEYLLYGLFFVLLAIGQCWVAFALTRRPNPRTVRYIAISGAWVVALWLLSRTSGLPVGPEVWRPESFGGVDIAASVAELLATFGCVAHLWTVANPPDRELRIAAEVAR
jgi:hypothetical protein